MKFGNKLIELREQRGLSQEELADELRVSRQTISNWENDKVSIDVDKAAEICRFFDVDMNFLFLDESNDAENLSAAAVEQRLGSDQKMVSSRSSSTVLWRSAIVVSAILLAVFAVFEIVVCALYFGLTNAGAGDISVTDGVVTSTSTFTFLPSFFALFWCAMVFGGLATSMSVVMLVVSVIFYRKYCKKDKKTDLSKQREDLSSDTAE